MHHGSHLRLPLSGYHCSTWLETEVGEVGGWGEERKRGERVFVAGGVWVWVCEGR